MRRISRFRFCAGTWLLSLTGRKWIAIVVPAILYGASHTGLDFLPPAEPFWGRALALTVVGCVWGWAFLRYLINGFDEQLFFLSAGFAVRIDNVDLRAVEPTIYPLSNGGAYLVSADRKNLRLYYLDGVKATLVREGRWDSSAQRARPASRDGFLWAQAQASITRYRREHNLDDIKSEPPQPDEYE